MSSVVIRVEGLSKRFKVGRAKQGYRTFREQITDVALKPVRALKGIGAGAPTGSREDDTIWALKDVSFEVKQGEALGIIGRNGAGKSTLLKVLSRITEPTEGQIEIRGRVGSLLEVGTGFHPELTGRENIFLNGAILGMDRVLIRRKFDEIVSFAEVERFIDTPVKHYSSGMYLRLAFAVAAHLEPEVLLVDEVLAVGDAAFQKKCLGKMSDVTGEGRTVLFVSHNMGAVIELCDSGLLLDGGTVHSLGPMAGVVSTYLAVNEAQEATSFRREVPDLHDDSARFASVEIKSGVSVESAIATGDPVVITLEWDVGKSLVGSRASVTVYIKDLLGQKLITLSNQFTGDLLLLRERTTAVCTVDRLPIVDGTYSLSVGLGIQGVALDKINNVVEFTVTRKKFYDKGIVYPQSMHHGYFLVDHAWSTCD